MSYDPTEIPAALSRLELKADPVLIDATGALLCRCYHMLTDEARRVEILDTIGQLGFSTDAVTFAGYRPTDTVCPRGECDACDASRLRGPSSEGNE